MAIFAVSKFMTGVSFSFKSSQGNILLTSARYSSMADCKSDIASLREAVTAVVEDHTQAQAGPSALPRYEIGANIAGEYYFCVISAGGHELARSGVFPQKNDCIKAIEYIRRNALNAKIAIRR